MELISLVRIKNEELSYKQLLLLSEMLDCRVIEHRSNIICKCNVEADVMELKKTIREFLEISDDNLSMIHSDIGEKTINKISNTSLYVRNNNLETEINKVKELNLRVSKELKEVKSMSLFKFWMNKLK